MLPKVRGGLIGRHAEQKGARILHGFLLQIVGK